MCAEVEVSFLDKLSLRNWYKYTLYLSAILLILAVSIDTKIEQSKLLSFSVWAMILSCAVWIFNEMLRVIFNYYEEKRGMSLRESLTEEQKTVLWIRFLVDWVAFGIWAGLLAQMLL